jgi:hypothetical protein
VAFAPRVSVGVEGLGFRDSDEAFRNVTLRFDDFSVDGVPFTGSVDFRESGRGYYNPRRYLEGKVFGALAIERGRWALSSKLAIGQLRETSFGGVKSHGLYTFGEIDYRYFLNDLTELHALIGRSGSRASSGGGDGYYRAYGGVYLTHWFD